MGRVFVATQAMRRKDLTMGSEHAIPKRERIAPVLFGADILTYSYAREFKREYGDVCPRIRLLCSEDVKMVTTTRYAEVTVDHGIENPDHLLEVAKRLVAAASLDGIPILLGSGDWYAEFLIKNRVILEKASLDAGGHKAVIPYTDEETFDKVMHKDSFYALCDEVGVPHPKTVKIDVKATEELPGDEELGLGWPVILKPADSAAWHYAEFDGKEKVSEVETRDRLDHLYAGVRSSGYDGTLILQDRIPGDDTVLYSLTVFCKDGRLIRSTIGHVLLQDHSPQALGNPVCIIDTMEEKCHKRLIEWAESIVKSLHYTGYGNFDVMYDRRDDTYRFLEMNARPGRNSYYVSLAGECFVAPIVRSFAWGENLEYCDLGKKFMFCAVPPSLVMRYVDDLILRERAGRRIAQKLAKSPVFDRRDTMSHNFWGRVTWAHQLTKFPRQYKREGTGA